jgi:hypothetical protein
MNYLSNGNPSSFIHSFTFHGSLHAWRTSGCRNSQFPHVLCLTEHHVTKAEITLISIDFYNLGAYFCRKFGKNGGVSIFVHQNLQCAPTDLDEFCVDQETEICAVKLHHFASNTCVITVYRSPTGNCLYFLNSLESILNSQSHISSC